MQRHFDNLLTNTIKALWEDPARTFTHYETRFFADWYLRQSLEIKEIVKELLHRGTFEIANGGHEMHDEVCPTYQDMLLNLLRGHTFLWDEF